MVRDDELRPARCRPRDDRVAHVEADEDAVDARLCAADEQPRVIPGLREMTRRDFLHEIHDFPAGHHTSNPSNASILFWIA